MKILECLKFLTVTAAMGFSLMIAGGARAQDAYAPRASG